MVKNELTLPLACDELVGAQTPLTPAKKVICLYPLVKHGNGKSSRNGAFKWENQLQMVDFQLLCSLTGGISNSLFSRL